MHTCWSLNFVLVCYQYMYHIVSPNFLDTVNDNDSCIIEGTYH